jgi:hypothetical protein
MPASLIGLIGKALASFNAPGADGNEGITFLAGRELNDIQIFLQVIVPPADAGWGHVFVDQAAVGAAQRVARSSRLGILCQVHSHPGDDTRHSDGDDDLILLPFERMLSIVVPEYGRNFNHINQASVHQFQRGRWVLCDAASIEKNFYIVNEAVDIR